MRWILAAAVALAAGTALAQPSGARYDIYIFSAASGEKTYAFSGADAAAAVEVRGCDAVPLAGAAALIARYRAAPDREGDGLSVVTLQGGHGRVELSSCTEIVDPADDEPVGEPNALIVIDGASRAQAQRLLGQIDAMSTAQRDAMRATLRL